MSQEAAAAFQAEGDSDLDKNGGSGDRINTDYMMMCWTWGKERTTQDNSSFQALATGQIGALFTNVGKAVWEKIWR